MVSILPSARTGMDVLGQYIGQGMTNAMPQMYENQKFQRGQSAIDQLQASLQPKLDENGQPIHQNPGEMVAHLARAIAANPSLERSGMGSKMLELVQAGMFPGALAEGVGSDQKPIANQSPSPIAQQQPVQKTMQPQEESKSPQEIDSTANQFIAEMRPDLINPSTDYGAINTFDAPIKMDLSAEEEAGLRQNLMKKYKSPAVVDSVVERVRQGIQNKFKEAQGKYGFNKERLEQIDAKRKEFMQGTPERLAPHISRFEEQTPRTAEELRNKYNQYALSLPTTLAPEQMHAQAMARLQNDINRIDALHTGTSMPPVHTEKGVADYLDSHKNTYKDLVKDGWLEAVREDAINNKDMGNEEFHGMIWGDQTNKDTLNKLNSFKAPIEYPPSSLHKGAIDYNKNYPKEQEKYMSNLTNTLKGLKPQDDLLLARAMVLNQNGTEKDFIKALNQAQAEGLKLSEFQRSQLQEIDIPRKPPLWEIFSEKNFKAPALKAWAPWINYIRGKK